MWGGSAAYLHGKTQRSGTYELLTDIVGLILKAVPSRQCICWPYMSQVTFASIALCIILCQSCFTININIRIHFGKLTMETDSAVRTIVSVFSSSQFNTDSIQFNTSVNLTRCNSAVMQPTIVPSSSLIQFKFSHSMVQSVQSKLTLKMSYFRKVTIIKCTVIPHEL